MPPKQQNNARMEAARRAQQKAKESQDKSLGFAYVIRKYPKLEPESDQVTTLTVLPYIVKEKHHPERIEAGEIWYRRPFKLHRNMGTGDAKRAMLCPRTFNPRNDCVRCDDSNSYWSQYRNIRDAREKEAAKEQAKELGAQNRELYLVYHHEEKEVKYMDESVGGGALRGFGALLNARLTNPPSEDCGAFYLDGTLAKEANIPGEGYALRVTWLSNKSGGGQREWVQPVSIDFIPRSQAPVPADVWKKSFDLSEMLVKVTSQEMEKAHLELPDDEEELPECAPAPVASRTRPAPTKPKQETEQETEQEAEPSNDYDEIPFELKPLSEQLEYIAELGKEELLELAKGADLLDHNGKPIAKLYARKPVEEVLEAVYSAWKETYRDDTQGQDADNDDQEVSDECPFGFTFGSAEDFGEHAECVEECPEATYDACSQKAMP